MTPTNFPDGTRLRARRVAGIVAAGGLVLTAVTVLQPGSARASGTSPAFVQQSGVHGGRVNNISATPSNPLTSGNRLVVEVGIWSNSGATTTTVSDSAGDPFVEITHFKASEGTEMSVWTAPITAGGGTSPTITARPTAQADMGMIALEYSGLSTATDATAVDQLATAAGTTGAAATVATGPTTAAGAGNELAVGLYADSGFGDNLTAGAGYTARATVAPTSDVELLAEDNSVAQGATPTAGVATGAHTVWLAATIVFKSGTPATPTVPGAPTNLIASPGDSSATVSWTAPSSGGSPITSYTITPLVAGSAQTPTVVSGSPPATTATVLGLTNGTTYTFKVAATNALGIGAQSAASSPTVPGVAPTGQWSAITNWPLVAVHSVLLKSGKLLVWDGWMQPQPTSLTDLSSASFATTNAPGSIFCSGMVQLPDGRVLVVGGDGKFTTGNLGLADTSIFDPANSTWTRGADMNLPRWYPTLTELPDGRYVAISGNSTNAGNWADTPEVYDPATNKWTLLSGVNTAAVHEEEYPFSYLAPNGRIFTIGPSEDNSFFLDVANRTWTPTGGASGIMNGSSVMYRPGKVLYSGGASSVTTSSGAKAGTAVIDLTAPTPAWRTTAPMANARVYHTLTMLADGQVLGVGGAPTSDQATVTTGVLPTEIWNPATETWTTAPAIAAARNYHSTALLLPDARVMVAGGGHPGSSSDPGQFSAQFFSPPYLFKGPRPTISSAPSAATYGASIPIATPDASGISAVNLVSLGSDTHQIDMAQHFVPLNFTASAGSLQVQAPATPSLAPPGDYMVFIVNAHGVPSTATIIHLGGSASPVVPGAPTSVVAAGGDGSASVSWTPPADGGSPITSYKVTPFIGSTAQNATTVTGNPPAANATITGLTNATAYTFTVTATNAIGVGPPSTPSNPVTPAAAGPSGVTNGGFESGLSPWVTGGGTAPTITSTKAHAGTSSAVLGTITGPEPDGDSSLSQTVTIPPGTSSLSFWYQPATADALCIGSACRWDWQEAQLRNTSGATLATVFKSNSNSQTWTHVTFNTTPYAGQTITLWFNVHQDNSNPPDDTTMYLDDVAVN